MRFECNKVYSTWINNYTPQYIVGYNCLYMLQITTDNGPDKVSGIHFYQNGSG